MKIKALSVRQPYASMIENGDKTIETRTWRTAYRGPLLICACAAPCPEEPDLPTGVALCIVDLLEIRKMTSLDERAAFVPFDENLYAWEIVNARPVERIFVRGMPGLFDIIQRTQTR